MHVYPIVHMYVLCYVDTYSLKLIETDIPKANFEHYLVCCTGALVHRNVVSKS